MYSERNSVCSIVFNQTDQFIDCWILWMCLSKCMSISMNLNLSPTALIPLVFPCVDSTFYPVLARPSKCFLRPVFIVLNHVGNIYETWRWEPSEGDETASSASSCCSGTLPTFLGFDTTRRYFELYSALIDQTHFVVWKATNFNYFGGDKLQVSSIQPITSPS